MVEDLAAEGSPEDVVRVLATTPSVKAGSYGRGASWSGRKPEVVAALQAAEELLTEQLAIQQDAVARGIAAKVARFVLDWARARRQTGQLHFHDLLVLCLELLREHDQIRTRLRGRFTHLLVDEFQDTDPLQIEIAVLLASAGDGQTPWHQAELEASRLFLVGDPKQSIYRFRRADIAVYERAKTQLRSLPVELSQNFRSVPGIVDWVNAVFTHAIGEGTPNAQPAYTRLRAERQPIDGRLAVHRFGQAADARAGEIRVLEAQDVAKVVQSVLDEGWLVQDGRTIRAARPSDIAILVRRHATVRLLERTPEDAHLPYRLESKSLIWATDEVRDLVTILQAIDDQTDEVAAVAALRHPAFGCSDLALLEWHAGGRVAVLEGRPCWYGVLAGRAGDGASATAPRHPVVVLRRGTGGGGDPGAPPARAGIRPPASSRPLAAAALPDRSGPRASPGGRPPPGIPSLGGVPD